MKIMQLPIPCLSLFVILAKGPAPVDSVLPMSFGSVAGDASVLPSDDLSSTAQDFPPLPSGQRAIRFLGGTFTSWFVNNNGHVSFDTAYGSFQAESMLPSEGVPPMMAAFWTDLDSRGGGYDKNQLWLRTSQSPDDRFAASRIVMHAPGADPNFQPATVCVATWKDVTYYGGGSARNTFQIVLAYNEFQTWLILGYERLEMNPGMPATVGFSHTVGASGQILTTLSSQEEMNAWLSGTNLETDDKPGVYAYRVDESAVFPSPSGPTSPPRVDMLFPFGGFAINDTSIPPNDDGSSNQFLLPVPMSFYGVEVESWFFNTNGQISFDVSYSATTASRLPSSFIPTVVAPYWTDINSNNGGFLWARTSIDETDLVTAAELINQTGARFIPDVVLVGTWDRVASFGSSGPERNSFQAIIAYNGRGATYVIFYYGRLQFHRGLTGVGFNVLEGSLGFYEEIGNDSEMRDLLVGSNVGLAGVYIFNVTDSGTPQDDLGMPFGPFGSVAGDERILGGNSGMSSQFDLSSPMLFFGERYTAWFLNLDGRVSFGQSVGSLTPVTLPAEGGNVAAVYWLDMDTQYTTTGEHEIWARTSRSRADLTLAAHYVSGHPSTTGFAPTEVAVGTWHKVMPSGGGPGLNSFQAVLAYNQFETWAIFSYGRLEFYQSGAGIGFTDADGISGFGIDLIHSDSAMQRLLSGTNCRHPGVYAYRVSEPLTPFSTEEPTSSPHPGTLPFEFGLYRDISIAPLDDWSHPYPGPLVGSMRFLGSHVTEWYISTNGFLSFDQGYTATSPRALPSTAIPGIAAVYWTDIDTRAGGSSQKKLWARFSWTEEDLRLAADIVGRHPDGGTFNPAYVAVATWYRVQALGPTSGRNSFQAVMTYNEDETWAIFSYSQLEFHSNGTGIGFNSPDGQQGGIVRLVDSDFNMTRLLLETNCGRPGTYAYKVSDFGSLSPPPSPIRPPMTESPQPSHASLPTSRPSIEDTPIPSIATGSGVLPFQFGTDLADSFIGGNDDGSSEPFLFPFCVNVYGGLVNSWVLNTNGLLTFEGSLSDIRYAPLRFSQSPALVAVYWVDIDTTAGGVDENELWARTSTSVDDVSIAASIVNSHPDGGSFLPEIVAVATWNKVSAFGGGGGRNTFQGILASSGSDTWVILAYSQLEFYEGSISVGGGAIVGLNGGGGMFRDWIGSTEDMQEWLSGSNCGIEGVYAFQVSLEAPEARALPFLFGPAANDRFTLGNDDGSSPQYFFPEPVNFYGSLVNSWVLNTNGLLTFEGSLSSRWYVLFPFDALPALVAVYWVDIDTSAGGVDENELWARTATCDDDLSIAASIVNSHPDGGSFIPEIVAVATWNRVSAFGGGSERNTFQAIMASSGSETWVILAYSQLEFYEGALSFGVNATVGLNDGGGMLGESIATIGSAADMQELLSGSNCGIEGVYAFCVSQD